jgi:PLP dependent protein
MLIGPQNSGSDALLAQRFRQLRTLLAEATREASRSEDSVTLLAVSKGHDAGRLRSAAQLGMMQFGESYVQEALPKIAQLSDLAIEWHFIGRLQANKTRQIARTFSWVHSVDRLRTAQRLSAQRSPDLPALNVCVQVRVANDPAKGGVDPDAALALLHAINALPRLQLRGLMCMLPDATPDAGQHQAFAGLRTLLEKGCQAGLALDTLSMGMSADMDAAIVEGATIVRVGTALFGPRAP